MSDLKKDLRYFERVDCLPTGGTVTLRVVGGYAAPETHEVKGGRDGVWQLQQSLAYFGFLEASKVDGKRDAATDAALKSFQGSANLVRDAIYGPKSQQALHIALNGSQASAPASTESSSSSTSSTAEEQRYDYFRKVIEGIGKFVTGANEKNVLGVRAFSNHKKVTNSKNAYDDTIYVLWLDAQGKKHCEHFRATTDPGSFAKYYNEKGDAHLVDGQYRYKVGTHKGYAAMNQAEEVLIWRDQDKDGVKDAGEAKTYSGWFGINIHAGGTTNNVGEWSAGCQVIWGGKTGVPYTRFMALMNSDPDKKIFYTLTDSSKLPPGNIPA